MKILGNVNEAVNILQSKYNVFIHGADATPKIFVTAMTEDASRLRDVTLYHIHTHGDAPYARPQFEDSFRVMNFFVGANVRPYIDQKRVDYIPCLLSEIPIFFRRGLWPLDVAVVQVSPPDRNGNCTLGVSVDVAKAAVDSARIVIAQVNPKMPRVHGEGVFHIDAFDYVYEQEEVLVSALPPPPTEIELRVGQNVASLIEDGSTIQLGIGGIPNAVAMSLSGHKDLGLHTEMWTNGTLDLIRSGAVTNRHKKKYQGKMVSSFIVGDQQVHNFINDNMEILQLGADKVNDPAIIKKNPKVCAINGAIEVDLTGQVCADSVGRRIVSGIGGQMDFMRGARLSEGGKAIVAITSRSKSGAPRIVNTLRTGAGVVTTRAHVDYVVTEYGIAELIGKSLGERAKQLIRISHPEDRDILAKSWLEL